MTIPSPRPFFQFLAMFLMVLCVTLGMVLVVVVMTVFAVIEGIVDRVRLLRRRA